MRIKAFKRQITLLSAVVFCAGALTDEILAQEYLSAGEVAAISAASVGIAYIGVHVKSSAHDNKSLIHGPILFDTQLQRFLGGACSEAKSNFLDNSVGSAATPVVFGTILLASDLSWPPTDDKGKMAAQDMFLFGSGLLATKGITSLAKGLVARERPLLCLEPGIAEMRRQIDTAYDRNSFFSGHASSAFFSAVYLNKRLRSIMRHELSPNDYDGWSWAPPTLLFSWASFVGWTRIHAYKHFFTDVAAGALAGFLVAELFYSFNDSDLISNSPGQPSGSAPLVTFRFTF
ncbi:MAG TPA: phosphatase PAP2 family protein [candidate division Zixibacteria bacterium]|nr:phosphatase PAP2 family protein [candidate division Zixibacteria bacterium]